MGEDTPSFLYLIMTQHEIQDALKTLRDEQHTYFAIKQVTQGKDYYIEANRNGILAYCNFLLNPIDRKNLEKSSTYEIPDSFRDNSDIYLSIKILEGNEHQPPVKESILTQAGCFFAIVMVTIVLIVGIVTSISWLAQLFD